MDIIESFHSLHLNDYFVFDKKVDPVTAIEFHIFIYDRKGFLNLYVQSRITQFMTEASLISGLE